MSTTMAQWSMGLSSHQYGGYSSRRSYDRQIHNSPKTPCEDAPVSGSTKYFDTAQEAFAEGKKYPGSVIRRAEDGIRFFITYK